MLKAHSNLDGISFEDYVAFRERADIGAVPGLFVFQHLCERRMIRVYGSALSRAVTMVYKGQYKAAYATASDVKQLQDNILARIVRESTFIKKRESHSETAAKHLLSFCSEELSPTRLQRATNEELVLKYQEFVARYSDFNFHNIPLWMVLGDALAAHLRREFEGVGGTLSEFLILQSSTKPTFVNEEERDFLAIAERLQRNRDVIAATSSVAEILASRMAQRLIDQHCSKYNWIEFDYFGPRCLEPSDFERRMEIVLTEGRVAERVALLKSERLRLKQRHLEIKRRHKIPSRRWRLFKDFQILGDLTDYRKAICSQAHVYLQLYLYPEISRRVKLPEWAPRYMSVKEVASCLKGKNFDRAAIRLRRDCVALVFDGTSTSALTGVSAARVWRQFQPAVSRTGQVIGQTASVGVATGRANIIRSAKELDKMRQGDVLIAPMTTPDFGQAIHKASAIVTDEGGVTCHAAIVSRELGIPCVIATRIGTTIFEDGQLIEVDADRGVVRRISDAAGPIRSSGEVPKVPSKVSSPRRTRRIARGPLLLNLADHRAKDEALTGGKAASLARLQERWRVPPGFCITVLAFEQFASGADFKPALQRYLGKLDIGKEGTVAKASSAVAQLFAKRQLSPRLRLELLVARRSLGRSLAVRSSGIGEDGESLSFAGQHSTYLNIHTWGRLQRSVLSCWSSLYSARALSYRIAHGLNPLDAKIAVVVQELVDAAKSGTVFTLNPISKQQELVVEATFGFGEALVSGTVTPDQYRIHRESLNLNGVMIGSKQQTILAGTNEGMTTLLSPDSARRQCLNLTEIQEICRVALEIEADAGKPQDIEWAITKTGVMYILQSRPLKV
jgi:phosphohistidine swiveling domain-containing protein